MVKVPKIFCLVTKIHIPLELKNRFADWQAKLNEIVALFPGFVSLEILFPEDESECVIVQRFSSNENVKKWRDSQELKTLKEDLKKFLPTNDPNAIREKISESFELKGGVTEVLVTEVSPEKEGAFREWMSKMHQIEAKFPGFKGVYVQSPTGVSHNWITLLQFDTPENLDNWLKSRERQKVLEESKSLIASLDSHRVVSPYAGWFSSISKGGKAPSVWKQTMAVLLVLFPIVMLELKFLNPHLRGISSTVATFVGNAISVSLVSWPMMPLVIKFLGWWLSPEASQKVRATILGTTIVVLLYLLEIALLWDFLKN